MDRLLRTPTTDDEWIVFNRQLLKAHLALLDMTYENLRVRLERIGIVDTEVNIRTRINRGRYSAVFLLQCLRAMDIGELVLPTDEPPSDADATPRRKPRGRPPKKNPARG